jgi:uncharacterized protein
VGRIILIILAVLLVAWLLRRALESRAARGVDAADEGSKAQGELVSCAHCGVHLPKAEARTAGGRHYCSEEHWRLGPREQ